MRIGIVEFGMLVAVAILTGLVFWLIVSQVPREQRGMRLMSMLACGIPACLIVSMLVTPADPFSMLLFAVPCIIIYCGIVAFLVFRK